jgi:type IV secretory pathway TrbD component
MADDTIHTDGSPAPPAGEPVHLPGPSYIPVVTALGLTLAVTGIVLSWVICGIGVVITLVALRLWIRDTRRDISELPLEH